MTKILDIDAQSVNAASQLNKEALRKFSARLLHEISQPLTAIAVYVSGCISKLEKDDYDKEQIIAILKTVNHQVDCVRDVIHHEVEAVKPVGS